VPNWTSGLFPIPESDVRKITRNGVAELLPYLSALFPLLSFITTRRHRSGDSSAQEGVFMGANHEALFRQRAGDDRVR